MHRSDIYLTENDIKLRKRENDKLRNPFDGKIARERDFDTYDDIQQQNKLRSMNRTKQAIYTYARCCEWEYFITLTFDEKKVDRFNFDECSKKAREWLHNQKKISKDLKYIIIPEQHLKGQVNDDGDYAWHFHGLLANCGDMLFVESGKFTKKSKQPIYNLGKYNFGWSTATKVVDVHKVAKYVGKYITKDLCMGTVGKARYFVSQNLPKPKNLLLYLDDLEENDFIDTFCNSKGKKIAHVSETQAKGQFTQCKYIELDDIIIN